MGVVAQIRGGSLSEMASPSVFYKQAEQLQAE